jgi:hypothetical protein
MNQFASSESNVSRVLKRLFEAAHHDDNDTIEKMERGLENALVRG